MASLTITVPLAAQDWRVALTGISSISGKGDHLLAIDQNKALLNITTTEAAESSDVLSFTVKVIRPYAYAASASPDGGYWVINSPTRNDDGAIARWDTSTQQWVDMPSDAFAHQVDAFSKDVAVGLVSGNDEIWYWNKSFHKFPGSAKQVVIGENNELWIIDMQWYLRKWVWELSAWYGSASNWGGWMGLGPLTHFAMQNSNRAIALIQNGAIFLYNGKWIRLSDPDFPSSSDHVVKVGITRTRMWCVSKSGYLFYANIDCV